MKEKKARAPVLLFVSNTDWFFLSHRAEIAVAAREAGYSVHLAAPMGEKREAIEALGIVTHDVHFARASIRPSGELATLSALAGLVRRLRPAIVHAVTPKPVLYLCLIARVVPVPALVLAISGLGHAFSARSGAAGIRRRMVVALYALVVRHRNLRVIFQNADDQRVLRGICPGIVGRDTLLRGSGVDLSRHPHVPETSDERPLVVMASRMLWDKGVGEFVAAADRCAERFPRAHFLLLGKLDDHPSAVSEAALLAFNARRNVSWLGHREDIPELFGHANLVVLPSVYGEGLPKVLLEAAASGRAVVTTDFPGCREAVIDGQTGVLVEPRDSAALGDAIVRLLEDAPRRHTMGEAGRRLAESEFSVATVVAAHLALYEELRESVSRRSARSR